MIRIDPAIAYLFTGCVSILWLSAAVHKLRAPDEYRDALERYQLVPALIVSPVAWLLPLIEVSIGLGILQMTSVAAIASIAVLMVYSVAIGINLARGRHDLDCGCGGPALRQNMSEGLVLRNGILMCASAVLFIPTAERALDWRDGITIGFSILSIVLIYMSANQLLATSHRPSRMGWWGAFGSG